MEIKSQSSSRSVWKPAVRDLLDALGSAIRIEMDLRTRHGGLDDTEHMAAPHIEWWRIVYFAGRHRDIVKEQPKPTVIQWILWAGELNITGDILDAFRWYYWFDNDEDEDEDERDRINISMDDVYRLCNCVRLPNRPESPD
jgi:hypothetical protein